VTIRPEAYEIRKKYWSAIWNEDKMRRGCERPGGCPSVIETASQLQYDHVPELGPKLFNIAHHCPYAVTPENEVRLRAEIAKCRVLCANCHQLWTHRPELFS
jgi:hypothetical protein